MKKIVRLDGIQPATGQKSFDHGGTSQRQGQKFTGRQRQQHHTFLSTPQEKTTKQQISKMISCPECVEQHGLWACEKFKKLQVNPRWAKAKEWHLCYRCLQQGHRGDDCPRTRVCNIDGCKSNHHRLLHRSAQQIVTHVQTPHKASTRKSKDESSSSLKSKELKKEDGSSDNCFGTVTQEVMDGESALLSTSKAKRRPISLRTIPVFLQSNGKRLKVNALLDDGSTRTFVNEDVATELGLSGKQQKVSVNVLNGRESSFNSIEVEMTLESVDGRQQLKASAFTTPQHVTGKLRATDWMQEGKKWEHLKGIAFPQPVQPNKVDLLIGLDCADIC